MNQKSLLFFSRAAICVLFFTFTIKAYSQDVNPDEFNLDTPSAPTATTETTVKSPSATSEIDLESELNKESAKTESDLELQSKKIEDNVSFQKEDNNSEYKDSENFSNLASQNEITQSENALYGFSVGLLYTGQYFHSTGKISSASTPSSFDQQTDNLQNVGFVLRYAITPYNSLGIDINTSYTTSMNHSDMNLTQISTIRGELNFCYAMKLGRSLPVYLMAGIGTEQVTGQAIERTLNKNGFGGQTGVGISILSKLNLEGMFFYYEHQISGDYLAAVQSKDRTADIDLGSAKVASTGILLRTTYSFNF